MTDDWLARLADRVALVPPLPTGESTGSAALDALWAASDGSPRCPRRFSATLFGRAESRRATEAIARFAGFARCVAIADDAGGNVAMVHVGGDLADMVVIWDHEEPIGAPAFASLGTFVGALLDDAGRSDLVRIARELPRTRAAEGATQARERAIFETRRDAYVASRDATDGFVALALAPRDDTLETFFEHGDRWVREEACRTLARVRPELAVARLERAALERPDRNVEMTCLGVLRRLATREAQAALARLRPHLPQYDDRFFVPEPARRG